MRLTSFSVQGYRSLVDVELPLGPLTVVHGVNGSGKSNLLRALALLRSAAQGSIAAELVGEGGLPRVQFATPRRMAAGVEPAVRLRFGARLVSPTDAGDVALRYAIALGIAPPAPTPFPLDPVIKDESVEIDTGRRPLPIFERSGTTALVTDDNGRAAAHPVQLRPTVPALSALAESLPEAALVARALGDVRVHAPVDIGSAAPARRAGPATRTARLAADGRDLAAAIATLAYEVEDQHRVFEEVCLEALGARVEITGGAFAELSVEVGDLGRPLVAAELSDGQLRFLAMAALALSPDAPTLLALDEPESSLAERAIAPLARVLAHAAERTGVVVVTHSDRLTSHLVDAGASLVRAERIAGATVLRPG